MAIKKKMADGGKAKPLGGGIGDIKRLKGKDLELEKKTMRGFGEFGGGPSIDKTKAPAPKPKMKMGGKMKKAASGGSFPDLNKDGKITKADILKGRGVIAKKGAMVKKCKYGCK